MLPSSLTILKKPKLNRLVNILEVNELSNKEQHSFRKEKSMNSTLIDFTDSVIKFIIDFFKIFDTISKHNILIKKLVD